MTHNVRFLVLFALLWMFLPHAGNTQSMDYHPLPTQKQLPVANVNAVLQDREGYMWYGTAGGGVCRDDGYTVVTYSSETLGKGIMENDDVTCMAETHQGDLWFGTRAGTYYIHRQTNTVRRVTDSHVGLRKVNCLGVTPDGAVWVGIEQDILKFSPQGAFLKALSIGSNKREEAKEMTVDSKGTLWVTILRGGLVSIDSKTDRLTHQPWDYPSAASYLLEDTLHHCYWVGTWGGGIVHYPSMEVENATLRTTESQNFGSEVYNIQLDAQHNLLWVATMDDIYAYRFQTTTAPNGKPTCHLIPYDTSPFLPQGKKLLNKLTTDRRGNLWVPGSSPHTFVLSRALSGSHIHREEVKAMSEQMGYKIMVSRIACEGDFFWIYQNRTRLSLYDAATGRLAFMATEAFPTPLSTQKPLSRCRADKGVWTCNARKLIHAWHEGMEIHWEEVPEAQLPNYISALSDEGKGRLLIGTEKQVFLYDYRKKTLTQLTDSVGIVQQVGYDAQGQLTYTTDPQAPKVVTDTHGHRWTLHELTLQEYSPKTGSYRTLHANDRNINMDSFSDITLAGDSICLGGIGAYCLIGSCHDLDQSHAADSIRVTRYDTLQAIHLSTMNHLHAAAIQFAYRFDRSDEWQELPTGENTIDISHLGHGTHTLYARATDEFGVWHDKQEVAQFSLPLPWYLRWYAWCIYVAIALLLWRLMGGRKASKVTDNKQEELDAEKGADGREQDMPSATIAEAPIAVGSTPVAPTPVTPTPIDPFMQQVTDWVQRNLDNTDYGVDDLCRDLGMSRMNMYRKFQAITDTTPSEFIKEYRLKKAAELLKSSTAKSITEISYEVGFTSPQYFAKCFKDAYGMTPRQYREGKPSEHISTDEPSAG